ncbi:glycosyltransferase [Fischerella sp. FACHB-380]|nr:glycosyltransferase [Fischerella sp. FACHB-380]
MHMDTQFHPKISILLPVFNGQRYIRECINSILNQSFTNFELLISNDCSTDDSHNIIQEFSDPRITYLSNQKNQGLFKNLNLILKLANAPIIRFICQDDILFSDCLENEILFFENHPEIDISFCKSHIIDRNGMTLSQGALKDLPDVIDSHLSMQLFYYYGCIPGNLSTVCIRRKCIDEVGLFNESLYVSGDYEMWVRICQTKKLGVIHKHLLKVRSHNKQLSRTSESGVRVISENREIRSKILTILPKNVHFQAKFYCQMRQNVLDVHHSIYCLRYKKLNNFLRILQIMGLGDFSFGLFFWLITLNNHLYKPQPKFI